MNIAVCIKQVPATESKIVPTSDGKEIDWTGLSYVVNPYDEFGVEEALRIKERLGTGKITAITIGPQKAAEALRACIAVGVDEAIHLKDPALKDGDSYSTAVVLASVLKRQPYDLIFFGKQSIDDDTGAIGIYVAAMMGIPHVAVVNKLEIDPVGKKAVAHRQIEGAVEVVETTIPALFTCQKGLNEPRYASLPGIMKAKQKPMAVLSLADLGLSPQEVGALGAKLYVEALEAPTPRSSGKIIEGDPHQVVSELIRLLREEAKVLSLFVLMFI